ncbi:syntaxin-18-like [Babylonia areolata]|uniref:syntaxin-18-like n=1 Tax=Babylonia areolata TaxID=304850 RepID=UPI003FD4AB6D
MADVTSAFKATVKAVKSRIKVQGGNVDTTTNILPASKQRGDFETKAREVTSSISKLRDFLLQHRKDYVNAGSLLAGHLSSMTDAERDQIDNDAQNIIKTCRETINRFRVEAQKQKVHPQVKEHRAIVIFLIDAYLKAVCRIYSEQKAVRVKRVVDKKKISRLEPDKSRSHVARLQAQRQTDEEGNMEKTGGPPSTEGKPAPRPQAMDLPEKPSYEDTDTDISPEEAQMFEEENKALYAEMNSMAEEVRQIEGKVVEIAKLQEIFTEKVLEQDKQIDVISTTVVGATINVKDANEEIREAIKKKAEFRVWILFFLVVCSFSLLFLDWYNG